MQATRWAFSLVELSIVLVILGLLVGGVLSGQSLIRAAEMRSVTTEYQRYYTAAQTFRDKYFAIPGDMNNATSFWGTAASCPGNAVATGTCNGDGDGKLNPYGATYGNEYFRYWQHLALAGLIEGTYSGVAGPGGASDAVVGTNVPRSRVSQAGWAVSYYDNSSNTGDLYNYAVNYGNTYTFGVQMTGAEPLNGALNPQEMWNIDKKMDDGKPGTGNMQSNNRINCTNSSSATDFTADYTLTVSSNICAFRVKGMF